MRTDQRLAEIREQLEEMNKRRPSSGGIGFGGLLTIIFIVLKVLGYIEWGWIWVFAPIWIPLLLAITILLIVLVFAIVIDAKN